MIFSDMRKAFQRTMRTDLVAWVEAIPVSASTRDTGPLPSMIEKHTPRATARRWWMTRMRRPLLSRNVT
jgi:hypothetical protein